MTSPKVGFFGPMKGLESAKHDVSVLPDGRIQATVEHETLRGVSIEMLRWWWENIDGTTTWNRNGFEGPPVPVYRYWHPFDHVRTTWVRKKYGPDGRLAAGSMIRIEEILGGRFPVQIGARVTRLDDSAFDFEVRFAGVVRGGVLDHRYEPTGDGCSFVTRLTLGVKPDWLDRFVKNIPE